MFVLGLVIGIAIVILAIVAIATQLADRDEPDLEALRAQMAIRQLRRQTIAQMLQEEQYGGGRRPSDTTDVIEVFGSDAMP